MFSLNSIDFNEFIDMERINESDYKTYQELIDNGIKNLHGAKENHFILENCYKKAVNYDGVTQVKEQVWNEILEIANKI